MMRFLAILMLIPGAACANTLTVTFNNDAIVSFPSESVYAGAYHGYINNNAPIDIYCVDINSNISFGVPYLVFPTTALTPTTQLQPGSVPGAAGNIAAVMGAYFSGSINDKPALQVAIWSVEYNGLNFIAGNTITGSLPISGPANVIADAISIINRAYNNKSDFETLGFQHTQFIQAVNGGYPNNARGQDMVSWAPEPSTFALCGLGGVGLAIGAYRRRLKISV